MNHTGVISGDAGHTNSDFEAYGRLETGQSTYRSSMNFESLMSVDILLDYDNFSEEDLVRARTIGEIGREPLTSSEEGLVWACSFVNHENRNCKF